MKLGKKNIREVEVGGIKIGKLGFSQRCGELNSAEKKMKGVGVSGEINGKSRIGRRKILDVLNWAEIRRGGVE